MTVPAPLRSTIGQPATGKEHYFERPLITQKIQRALDNKRNILISAPRRIGKSSLLNHLLTQAKDDQVIKYLSVQSIDNSNKFFQVLFKLLIEDSQIFGQIGSYTKQASSVVTTVINRFRGISFEGGLQVSGHDSIDYFKECLELLEALEGKQVIILLDEFPDAVNNLLNKSHEQAINFLQQTRELRQMSNQLNLQFIYTGSTGLANVVRQLDQSDLINDLYEVKVPPYTEQEATDFIRRLALGHQHYNAMFQLDEHVIQHIVRKITWRLPYYLQVIVECLADSFEVDEINPTPAKVDDLLEAMIQANSSYYGYFEYWSQRLKRSLSAKDQKAAIDVLNHISLGSAKTLAALKALPTLQSLSTLQQLLNILEHDGYISENQETYGFNSYLLQQWWIKHVAE